MGQQQLLLIVLGVIIVGIAVVIGIFLFQQNSIENKRDLVLNEGLIIAANAKAYYHKPREYGGGNNSFENWVIPSQMINSPNGSFEADVTHDKVEITGTGNEVVSGSDSVKVKIVITPTNVITVILK